MSPWLDIDIAYSLPAPSLSLSLEHIGSLLLVYAKPQLGAWLRRITPEPLNLFAWSDVDLWTRLVNHTITQDRLKYDVAVSMLAFLAAAMLTSLVWIPIMERKNHSMLFNPSYLSICSCTPTSMRPPENHNDESAQQDLVTYNGPSFYTPENHNDELPQQAPPQPYD
jgi:hypothetical protein